MGCGVCADDHARIKLKVESSPSRSDYINASPIVSGSSSSPLLRPIFILPGNSISSWSLSMPSDVLELWGLISQHGNGDFSSSPRS